MDPFSRRIEFYSTSSTSWCLELYISLWSRLIFISYTFFVSRIMSIYIYDSALHFPLCLSCALYFYLDTFFIFVTKKGRSIKHTCKVNQIPTVEFIGTSIFISIVTIFVKIIILNLGFIILSLFICLQLCLLPRPIEECKF